MEKAIKEALAYIEKSRGISKEVLLKTIQEALQAAYKKKLGVKNVRVSFDQNASRIKVFVIRKVVECVSEPKEQISLDEARKIKEDIKIGDTIEIPASDSSLTRISAQVAKQVITQRIREAERNSIFQEFIPKVGDIVTGFVRKVSEGAIFVDIGKVEAILPAKEQIKREKYRVGERLKAYIVGVEQGLKHPQVILSRTHPGIIKRLFETEIPEFADGSIKIEKIVREPGVRLKVVVSSSDKNISPVGAIIGINSSRISALLKELRGERVDIIPYSNNIKEFIRSSISPAKANKVIVNEAKKEAVIIVDKDQLSLAIGRDGQNIRLSAKLCGFKLDVRTKEQYWEQKPIRDIPNISEETICLLNKKNIYTFKDIMGLSIEDLAKDVGGEKIAEKIIEYIKSLEY